MRIVIAVISLLIFLFGVLGFLSHDISGSLFILTGAICFTLIIAANDIVAAIEEATKAMMELRKRDDGQKP
jgi:hypothetical protein